jgi:uncharacterized membrane protein
LAPIVLVLSMALNLVLVGAFIGRWTMPFRSPPPGGPAGMMRYMIDDMGRNMSPSDRAILQNVYQAHATAMQDRWAEHREAFDAVRRAMGAQPFDRGVLERALDAASQLDAVERDAVGQTLVDAASQMSAEGRQRMSGWQPGPRGPSGPDPGSR